MYKIGDKVKLKDSINIWTIRDISKYVDAIHIVLNNSNGIVGSKFINSNDLLTNYTKVKSDDEQLDLSNYFNWGLPSGKENNKEQNLCNHLWKIYNGLNFSDEYCELCGLKRELQNK